MAKSIVVESITIEGFRAFLRSQTLALSRGSTPRSLAILAQNAHGKSSIVDAVEYYFSLTGTLERLGEREFQTKTGRKPLMHVRAEADNVSPNVSMFFRESGASFGDARPVVTTATPLTAAAKRVAKSYRVSPIIRGHELRRFVEEHTPEERYSDLARWFELEPITQIQKNLANLRRGLTNELRNEKATDERLKDVRRETNDVATTADVQVILKWVNEHRVLPLGVEALSSLSVDDPSYAVLLERKKKEDARGNAAKVAAALECLNVLRAPDASSGLLKAFDTALQAHAAAVAAEAAERGRAEKQLFARVWEAAEPLLAAEDLASCPVCDRPFEATGAGSRASIRRHLEQELALLSKYRMAVAAVAAAAKAALEAARQLQGKLDATATTLSTAGVSDVSAFISSASALAAWLPEAIAPDLKVLITAIEEQRSVLAATAAPSGPTASAAIATIDRLRAALDAIAEIGREREALLVIQDAVSRAQTAVDQRIRSHMQSIVARLHDRMNEICNAIQSHMGEPPVYRLALPNPNAQQQNCLHLTCDFGGRTDVAPQGYLSDAQMSTLALALRLAAIQLLNVGAPFVVLDDIVTSYDVDHRKAIADLLASDFAGMQVLLVTHDAQFFDILRDQLPDWTFKRITSIDPAWGPKFADHQVADEQIQARWDNGDCAGNDIRQAEEDWLFSKCREFGAKLTIREPEKAHKYERSELATALQETLKSLKIAVPKSPKIRKPMLESLKVGVVENFGSHFQVDPSSFKSIGDEKRRWEEFCELRDFFACSACGGSTFFRAKNKSIIQCAAKECGTAFSPSDANPSSAPPVGPTLSKNLS